MRQKHIGDRVRVADSDDELEILAIHGSWAWCKRLSDNTLQTNALIWLVSLRIESDVPQSKYAVGQKVLSPGGSEVIIVALGPAYRVEYPDGTHTWWEEELLQPVLEAVPDSPTCGGKVS